MSEPQETASNFLTITGLSRATRAEYIAQWNGHPLRIKLDMAATLKLLGDADSCERAEVLSAQADLVAEVARRLIDLRIEKPSGDHAIVMISALDLDPTSAHHRVRHSAAHAVTAAMPRSIQPAAKAV
jgi:hypothetical protein